ncbi:MAG: WbuC family cupin fold metalloprotein [Cyanobacteriota bacterium]|nr:WbuC family cupin fold metalloprotein [Cyanobacteriota bacterium]
MRITVIGCGYVGKALARHWKHRGGQHLTVTTTREQRQDELRPLAERVLVMRADDPQALRNALADAEVAVFSLAPSGNQPVDAATYATTYRDSFRTLQAVAPELPNLRQIVYTGSCSVYGDSGGDWVDETAPVVARDSHAEVLLESESLLLGLRSNHRRVCVFRLGALYGPGRELTARFRRLAGTTRSGSGAHHSHWIHRDDVVGAIDAAVQRNWDGLVNLVDDRPQSLARLLDAVCDATGEVPIRWDPDSDPGERAVDRRISNRLLKSLGFTLQHPELRFPSLRPIDRTLFNRVAEQARQSPRLRCNHNFHNPDDLVQRFLNVLQPGTYVRPHCHRRATPGSGFESFLVLQGSLALLVFDARGRLIQQLRLDAGGPIRGVELGEGQFHTLVALEPDTVIFELKQGPYRPASDKDFLECFPPEGTPEADRQEAEWRESCLAL